MLLAQLPPSFADALKNIKVGGYTPNPVKTPLGYHVIKLLEEGKASFESLRPFLKIELEKKALADLKNHHLKKGDVVFFDTEGKPLPKPSSLPHQSSSLAPRVNNPVCLSANR